ncbi:DNA-binding protein [Sedimentitalea sp. CY04]|uniref:DNA-binding protein n=1 Tax=Parasedimentitalea denitrificans TaxID=2211118 RepID=A0ABX0W9L7_9RHOB|nr:helix-turn-helix domain-containing protein [Sedimentitalea sp. CY04]NIZ62339.1 DNA-binding protein [Sedimentitalea sp. CY04]
MKTPKYYSVLEIADIFGRNPRTIRDWITKGCPTAGGTVRLRATKLGRSWDIKDEWLLLFEHRIRPDDEKPEFDL